MDITIIILKRCCSHGFAAALKLKTFLDTKGYNCGIQGKKRDRYAELVKKYNMVFDLRAILYIEKLNVCIYENELDGFILNYDYANGITQKG